MGQPLDGATPKTVADEHSLGARWVTLQDLKTLPLRNIEVLRLLVALAKGARVYPLDVLQVEGEVVPTA